ncbi:SGNH/GDSL hydrolase family protein [Amycolatopsis jejuensis]|uniref:SGNH/GDSL hydrolase family protein n=1 Tax=Amycolatopsis jejuensis TaxID=330084 RepID=UPI0005252905|nr:SGNH/GDSL hydrolase family protein [Amycolatopsis jejuensis]
MRIEFPDDRVTIAGALDLEPRPGGVLPRRLPAWTRVQATDPYLNLVEPRPAGVRLVFRTTARSLKLDVRVTRFRNIHFPLPPVMFDLVLDGDLAQSRPATAGDLCIVDAGAVVERTAGNAETILFEELPEGRKSVEIWLPQASVVELQALDADGEIEPDPITAPRWIHYGSSISHCAEASSPTATWPALVARQTGLDLLCLAFAGSCHLDPFIARTIRDTPAAVISLKVAVNVLNMATMSLRTFGPALHGFLDTIREGHPETPILVVSPIVFPSAENRAGPTPQGPDGRYAASGEPSEDAFTLRRMREIVREMVTVRKDEHLNYLDGLTLLDAEYLYDGLHPTAEGYRVIAERFHDATFGAGGLLPVPQA